MQENKPPNGRDSYYIIDKIPVQVEMVSTRQKISFHWQKQGYFSKIGFPLWLPLAETNLQTKQ